MNWVKAMKKDGRDWVQHSDEVKSKLDVALKALDTISRGYWYEGDGKDGQPLSENLKATAAGSMRRIAQMTQSRRPSSYYF